MQKTLPPVRESQRARLYIYIKQKNCKTFIYIQKPDTLQKARQFPLRFYSQKYGHFMLRNFSRNFWNWHLYIYKKHNTLRYVDFYILKSRHLDKSKKVCVTFFYIQKVCQFALRDFMEFLKISGGGGVIFINKNNALCVNFL